MAADNPFANLGLEFMRWQNVPSLREAISGGKSPLLNILGIALAGSGTSEEQPAAEGLGQGIAPPSTPGGMGINMNKPSGVGIAPSQFQMPNLALPKIGTAPSAQPGIDVDGDGQIDNFWGIKKK